MANTANEKPCSSKIVFLDPSLQWMPDNLGCFLRVDLKDQVLVIINSMTFIADKVRDTNLRDLIIPLLEGTRFVVFCKPLSPERLRGEIVNDFL